MSRTTGALDAREAGTLTREELAAQPDTWRRVLAESATTTRALPAAGEPVLFLGCGTSYYVGQSYARRRVRAGLGPTRAAIPSELDEPIGDEVVVVLSRSGTTADVAAALDRAGRSRRTIGVLGTAPSPIADRCDEVVLIDYADDRSVVQTRFATSAALLLRASLGEDLRHLPDQAARALALPLPDPLPTHLVFLASGPALGLAHEAALKCLESAGVWAEAYASREYQHGPVSAAGPGALVWSMEPPEPALSDAVRATGARLVAPDLDPLAQLPAVHRLAVALAAHAGRDPDLPPHLSRSVTEG